MQVRLVMTNLFVNSKFKYDGNQFEWFCRVLAFVLVISQLRVFPYISELYLEQVPYERLIDLAPYAFFPSIFHLFRNSFVLHGASILMMGLALLIGIGKFRKIASVLYWYLMASFYALNHYTLSPELAFLGWLLLMLSLIPTPSIAEKSEWRMPTVVYLGALTVLGFGYMYAGYTKFQNPNWRTGEALGLIFEKSPITYSWIASLAGSIPDWFLNLASWSVLGTQLLALPLLLLSFTRPYVWSFFVLVHLFTLITLDLSEVAIGMLVFHLFVADGDWLERVQRRIKKLTHSYSMNT